MGSESNVTPRARHSDQTSTVLLLISCIPDKRTQEKLQRQSQVGTPRMEMLVQDTPQCVGTYNSHGISMQSSLSTKFGFLMYRSSMCVGHTYVAHLKQCLASSEQSRVQISLWHTKTKGKIRKKAPLCHLLAPNPQSQWGLNKVLKALQIPHKYLLKLSYRFCQQWP